MKVSIPGVKKQGVGRQGVDGECVWKTVRILELSITTWGRNRNMAQKSQHGAGYDLESQHGTGYNV